MRRLSLKRLGRCDNLLERTVVRYGTGINDETTGQPIARLSITERQLALQQAQANLKSAEAQLAAARRLKPGQPTAAVASDRAAVASAQANLSTLQQGATAAAITIAQASVDQAQITLNQLTAPSSASTIASAEATLAQAQVAVTEAQLDLEHATLTAPFAGVIAAVTMNVGDTAGSTTTISVLDPSDLYVELSLSESDVADAAVGQPVTLVFDALSATTITGTITAIAPTATVSSNVATYPVRVSFDPGDQPIKVGMTASGTIITEEHTNVLLVPTRAIQTQGTNHVVQVQQPGNAAAVTVVVTTGLSSDGQTEILITGTSGNLVAGDVLLIASATSSTTSATTTSSSQGNLLSGLSGPPDGGAGGPPAQ